MLVFYASIAWRAAKIAPVTSGAGMAARAWAFLHLGLAFFTLYPGATIFELLFLGAAYATAFGLWEFAVGVWLRRLFGVLTGGNAYGVSRESETQSTPISSSRLYEGGRSLVTFTDRFPPDGSGRPLEEKEDHMPCFVALIALATPRLAIVLIWFSNSVQGTLRHDAVAGPRLLFSADDLSVVYRRTALVGRPLDVLANRGCRGGAYDRPVTGARSSQTTSSAGRVAGVTDMTTDHLLTRDALAPILPPGERFE